jgi:hypothetical protein
LHRLFRVVPAEGGENLTTNARFWGVIGRLKPGVPESTVNAELATIAARFAQTDPNFYGGWEFSMRSLREAVVSDYRTGLWLVIGAALLVLLITCANVAGLQLVRASTRQREVALRLALGASRRIIARSFLVESLLLVAIGGIAGVLLGAGDSICCLGPFRRNGFRAPMRSASILRCFSGRARLRC